ncbi:flavin reductase family protein [Streptomyces genisteinicus]|uniref:Flavin reductase family protein n=1 Tax=Streptomyces genisteinicus TaxID=2768068 RepID=A0A7H0HNC2_9ACTN|nr:flavin reductase family protein [Streptomyces genisteinicus]QNP62038.1 flavin reductase family protein [Streptomyces genisteinicus]
MTASIDLGTASPLASAAPRPAPPSVVAPRNAPTASVAPVPAAPVAAPVEPVPAGPDTPGLLRSVFRRHAAGVAVITAHGERPVGFTATSLTSVAAEPPLVSFGIGTGSSSWPVLAEADHVGVHVLGEHQDDLAARFARSGVDRFAEPTGWRTGPQGVPVLDGVLAWLVGRVVARVPAGDHSIVIAEIVDGGHGPEGSPLLYHQGRFTGLRT